MNLESLLPLLTKNSDPQTATLLSALSGGGGDKSKLFESLMPKDGHSKELFNALSMMQTEQKKSSQTHARAEGLKVIYNFAPTDILGVMMKHYGKK